MSTSDYRKELELLMEAYIDLIEVGYYRILDNGGTCDTIETMVKNDPALIRVREVLKDD